MEKTFGRTPSVLFGHCNELRARGSGSIKKQV